MIYPGRMLTADDVQLENGPSQPFPMVHIPNSSQSWVRPWPAPPPGRNSHRCPDPGSPTAGLAVGPDARVVPFTWPTPVSDLIRTGDVVDVLGAQDTATHARLIATNAVVVPVSAAAKAPGAGNDRVVLRRPSSRGRHCACRRKPGTGSDPDAALIAAEKRSTCWFTLRWPRLPSASAKKGSVC